MATSESGLDNIIKKNFANEIQQKRVKKEITSLRDLNQGLFKISLISTTLGLKITVEITKELLSELFREEKQRLTNPVVFELLLEPKFPFVFPKLFCRTKFTDPSLADGRDYTNNIIGKIWTPSVLLSQIVGMIPEFILKVTINKEKINLQKIGTYHLGHIYDLEDFLLLESVACFPAREIMTIKLSNPDRYVVITESNFLNFELQDKKKNTIKLISWANLQSLLNIKRKKEDESSVVFTWRDKSKNDGVTQTFQIEDSNKAVEIIISNMKRFGVKVSKNILKQPDLKMEEVTCKAYEQINIQILIDNIAILESKLMEELTLDTVSTLMNLYQKAVEYFSAMGDPLFENYIDKLHLLLSREDVQVLLRSKEEVSMNSNYFPKKQAETKYKKTNDDDDEEEEKKAGPQHAKGGSPITKESSYMQSYEPIKPKPVPEEIKSTPMFDILDESEEHDPKKTVTLPSQKGKDSPRKVDSPRKTDSPRKGSNSNQSPAKPPAAKEQTPKKSNFEEKKESPRVEATKVETPKAETPKVEAPKVEEPKVHTPKVETPKVEVKPANTIPVDAFGIDDEPQEEVKEEAVKPVETVVQKPEPITTTVTDPSVKLNDKLGSPSGDSDTSDKTKENIDPNQMSTEASSADKQQHNKSTINEEKAAAVSEQKAEQDVDKKSLEENLDNYIEPVSF
jgi:hypothetical protein